MNSMRSHNCGQVNESLIDQVVTVSGWAHRRRDHGGVIFIDLRDASGLLQVVVDPDAVDAFALAETVRNEHVLKITARVRPRPEGTTNPEMPTGMVEVYATDIEVLNRAAPIPFQLDEEDVSEAVRLRYRYLDLRRESMQKIFRLRSGVTKYFRDFLEAENFVDIETPILTKSTPEGARDYLVPSRVHQGDFFALPQSPQLFKQLLMVAGFERYYQIARCFRSYAEAVEQYGIDRPDLRIPLKLVSVTDLMKDSSFKVFSTPANSDDGRVAALCVPGGSQKLSRKEIDDYTNFVSNYGARGLAYIKVNDTALGRDGLQSPIVKNLSDEALDMVEGEWAPMWVVDFPMFERDEETGRWTSLHHPFTAPKLDQVEELKTNPGDVLSRAYDMVLNGTEIGGGSIRIHQTDVQKLAFEALGIDDAEAEEKFGFLLDALRYGAPPHGGIAFGVDRITAMMSKVDSIRDVIAFPKTQKASDLHIRLSPAAQAAKANEPVES